VVDGRQHPALPERRGVTLLAREVLPCGQGNRPGVLVLLGCLAALGNSVFMKPDVFWFGLLPIFNASLRATPMRRVPAAAL